VKKEITAALAAGQYRHEDEDGVMVTSALDWDDLDATDDLLIF
jgi:hypothetical protein